MSRSLSDPVSTNIPHNESKSVGVMLWGPPGCGKSSSAYRLIEAYKPMYFINTDTIVESIIKNYFHYEYTTMTRKKKHKMKEEFYWWIRKCNFQTIMMRTYETYIDVILRIFYDVFKDIVYPNSFDIDLYIQREYRYKNFWMTGVYKFIMDFSIHFAKQHNQNFMIETIGRNFHIDFVKSIFNVHNILQVVFVSSPETLIDRVSRRNSQLINSSPNEIRNIYDDSYFHNFAVAVKSEIFHEIIVDVNDTSLLRVIHLKKIEFKKYAHRQRYPYILEETASFQSRIPTESEKHFIKKLFSHANLPQEFIRLGIQQTSSWFDSNSIFRH
jgi:GTPase SAR1 family protein